MTYVFLIQAVLLYTYFDDVTGTPLLPYLRPSRALGDWLAAQFSSVKQLPRFLVPKYFEVVVQEAYAATIDRAW